jgi:hypothetical protein
MKAPPDRARDDRHDGEHRDGRAKAVVVHHHAEKGRRETRDADIAGIPRA